MVTELARVATGGGWLPEGGTGRVLEAGDTLGRYVILGKLGAGAMGVVYSAHDPVLGRQVAIKVLRELHDAESRARLLHEARILAQLSHPNVSAVYDAGHDAGVTYLAMEYLPGTSLRVHLLLKPPTWAALLAVFRQAAEGLAAAHEVGIVQRDFKPDNVMVTPQGRVVVTDFGLALAQPGALSALGEVPLDSVQLRTSRRDQLIGSPAYMAPEQLHGKPASADSDQFSFCVCLHEAVTGTLPFSGATVGALTAAVDGNRRAPFAPKVTPPTAAAALALSRLLERGLAREPSQRFSSMRELVTALDALTPRPKRSALIAASFAAVALALGGGTLWWQQRARCAGASERIAASWGAVQRQALSTAFEKSALPFAGTSLAHVVEGLDAWATQWAEARTKACEETYVKGAQPESVYTAQLACFEQRRLEAAALIDVLSGADPSVVTRAVGAVSALPPLALCAQTNVLLAPVPAPSTPQMQAAVDALLPELAKSKALNSAGQFAQSLELAKALGPKVEAVGYKPLTAAHLATLGAAQRDTGDAASAAASFFACTRAATEGRDDARSAECQIGLIFTKGLMQGAPEEAHAAARTAESLMTRLAEDWHLRAVLLSNEGALYSQEGQLEKALPVAEHAVALLTKELGPEHNEVARAQVNLGAVYVALHRYTEAETVYHHAMQVFERVLGPDHPSIAVVLNNMIEVLASQKRYADARLAGERALAIRAKVLGPTHRQTMTTRFNLAGVQSLDGHLEEARASYELIIAQWEKDLGPTHLFLGDPLSDLGTVLRELGRPVEALVPLERALALRATGKEGPYKLASTQLELALTLQAGHRDLPRAKGLATAAVSAYEAGGNDFTDDLEKAKHVRDSLH